MFLYTDNCHLASRHVGVYEGDVYCNVARIEASYAESEHRVTVGTEPLFAIYSDGTTNEEMWVVLVVPVVTLKPNVLLDNKSTFYTETVATVATDTVTEYIHTEWNLTTD